MGLGTLWRRLFPVFDWLQVEITTRCNAACAYCPRAAFAGAWRDRTMGLEEFAALAPALAKTRFVHLQGWGEPLLNPAFPDMLRLAKAAGCRVSTTTNGTLVDRDMARRMVGEGLDLVAFSVAGADEKGDVFRRGAPLARVLRALEELDRAKAELGLPGPRVHLAYMLLRSGLDRLEDVPGLLERTGADEAVVSSLTLVASPELAPEARLADTPGEFEVLLGRMAAVRDRAEAAGRRVSFHVASPFVRAGRCPEGVGRSAVVGADGCVSPCVMARVPVEEGVHLSWDGPASLARLHFGDVGHGSLDRAWNSPEYRAFRASHVRGRLPSCCGPCLKRWFTAPPEEQGPELTGMDAKLAFLRRAGRSTNQG